MTRLYGNENLDEQVIGYLRKLGYDVLTAKEAGKANQRIPDEQVLEIAIAEKRAVLTFNRKDFFRLHKTTPNHFGIIACAYDADYERLARRIHTGIEKQGGTLNGKLIRVYRPA